jgi:hypothetical protein
VLLVQEDINPLGYRPVVEHYYLMSASEVVTMSLHLFESLKTQLAAALTIKILMPPLYLYTPSRRRCEFFIRFLGSLGTPAAGSLFLFHGITYFIARRVCEMNSFASLGALSMNFATMRAAGLARIGVALK